MSLHVWEMWVCQHTEFLESENSLGDQGAYRGGSEQQLRKRGESREMGNGKSVTKENVFLKS